MTVKLFFSNKSKFEHESEQLKEIYELISKSDLKDPIYIFTNFLLSNSEIDCLILTKNGPVILELKSIKGDIIGDENGSWTVKTESSEKVLLDNLFQQLKSKRFDFVHKLNGIRDKHFPRVEHDNLIKISCWGYFKKGSTYADGQVNPGTRVWFDIVTEDDLITKLKYVNAGYTLTRQDMDAIVEELHLTEYFISLDDKIKTEIPEPPAAFESENPLSEFSNKSNLNNEIDNNCEKVMTKLIVFEGNCPKSVSKDAKYSVKLWEGEYVVGIVYESDEGELWYPINEKHSKLVEMVNIIKNDVAGSLGGSFYINEFKQVIVPTAIDNRYFLAGEYNVPLQFVFENHLISGDAMTLDGTPLSPGDEWEGPHAGIPYIITAGAKDIRYEYSPRPQVIRKVQLSKYQKPETVRKICRMIYQYKGGSGGRFYINEFLHMFAPINENELKYVYIGKLESLDDWFPKFTGNIE